MKKVYAVYLNSDYKDKQRDELFYERGYNYEWFTSFKKAKAHAKQCYDEIKEMMNSGKVVFNENSTITIDIESYDDWGWKNGDDIDYETYALVFAYTLQGGY